MEEQLKRLEQLLRANTEIVQTKYGKLSAEELNLKANAQAWSIAQTIEHLIIINSSYYPIVAQIRAGSYKLPFLARFGFISRFFGDFILKSVMPNNPKKIKTFSVWEPSKQALSGDIVQRFVAHHEDFIAFMWSCQDLLKNGQVICSPASRTVVYKLEAAFNIIVMHEQRHLEKL